MSYLVIFRPHGELALNTQHIGPYDTHDEAMDALAQMPALGACPPGQPAGVKFIEQLHARLDLPRLAAMNAWTVTAVWDSAAERIVYRVINPDHGVRGGFWRTEADAWASAATEYMRSTQVTA